MEITINIDDQYMGELMASIHNNAEQCVMESIGVLKWLIDMKKSGKVICMCDANGHNLEIANIPILENVRTD